MLLLGSFGIWGFSQQNYCSKTWQVAHQRQLVCVAALMEPVLDLDVYR